jgi:hypothetical protein
VLACLSDRLGSNHIDLALIAVADMRGERGITSIELVDGNARVVIGRSIVELTSDKDRARTLASALVRETQKLLDSAGHMIGGRIVVEATPPEAAVSLGPDIRRDQTTPNVFLVEPGRHVLFVTAAGHEDRALEVVVERALETKVEARLEPSTSVLASPWLWTAVGIVAIGTTVGAVLLTREADCTCVGAALPCHGC